MIFFTAHLMKAPESISSSDCLLDRQGSQMFQKSVPLPSPQSDSNKFVTSKTALFAAASEKMRKYVNLIVLPGRSEHLLPRLWRFSMRSPLWNPTHNYTDINGYIHLICMCLIFSFSGMLSFLAIITLGFKRVNLTDRAMVLLTQWDLSHFLF